MYRPLGWQDALFMVAAFILMVALLWLVNRRL